MHDKQSSKSYDFFFSYVRMKITRKSHLTWPDFFTSNCHHLRYTYDPTNPEVRSRSQSSAHAQVPPRLPNLRTARRDRGSCAGSQKIRRGPGIIINVVQR